MGRKEKEAYREAIRQRYAHSNRAGKKQILDEFCAICRYNRKYAIRLLGKWKKKQKARRGRRPTYAEPLFIKTLQYIWKASDFMCSRRLKVVIPMWLPFYEQSFEPLAGEVRARLLLSADRHLTVSYALHVRVSARDCAVPSQAPCCAIKSPSAPTTGILHSQALWKQIRLLIAAPVLPANSFGASS